ncbi:MAG TPA: hypothetical protein VIL85_20680 [Thermomicrobiales bacterium]
MKTGTHGRRSFCERATAAGVDGGNALQTESIRQLRASRYSVKVLVHRHETPPTEELAAISP